MVKESGRMEEAINTMATGKKIKPMAKESMFGSQVIDTKEIGLNS